MAMKGTLVSIYSIIGMFAVIKLCSSIIPSNSTNDEGNNIWFDNSLGMVLSFTSIYFSF
jgi:hypothetical protein